MSVQKSSLRRELFISIRLEYSEENLFQESDKGVSGKHLTFLEDAQLN